MRILLDEGVPRRLRQHFANHDVRTVPEMGWSGEKNGELLRLMAGQGFSVLMTVDQNIRHQQRLQSLGVALIVLRAPSNRLADILPLVPAANAALASIVSGDVIEITA